jgi:hypothetical protein
MKDVLVEIIELLTAGITQMAEGIGKGLNALATNIFVTTGTDGTYSLSSYGALIIVFAGVTLAVGLCTRVVIMIENLGK